MRLGYDRMSLGGRPGLRSQALPVEAPATDPLTEGMADRDGERRLFAG